MKKQTIVLFDIDYTLFDTGTFKKSNLLDHSLYSEVLPVIKELSKKYILGIFSEGETSFQKEKLRKTKILDLFIASHVNIVEKKDLMLEKILKKYKNYKIILVDDKLSVLHKAKMISPFISTIWVKRGKYAESQLPIENFSSDVIIENLKNIVSIIDKM